MQETPFVCWLASITVSKPQLVRCKNNKLYSCIQYSTKCRSCQEKTEKNMQNLPSVSKYKTLYFTETQPFHTFQLFHTETDGFFRRFFAVLAWKRCKTERSAPWNKLFSAWNRHFEQTAKFICIFSFYLTRSVNCDILYSWTQFVVLAPYQLGSWYSLACST